MKLSDRINEVVQTQKEYASGVMDSVSKSTQDAIIQEMAKFRGMRDSAIELEGERNKLIAENAALKNENEILARDNEEVVALMSHNKSLRRELELTQKTEVDLGKGIERLKKQKEEVSKEVAKINLAGEIVDQQSLSQRVETLERENAALKERSRKYKWLPYTGDITSFLAGTYGFIDAEGTNYYGTVITKSGYCIVTLAWTDNKGAPRFSQWHNRYSMYGDLPNFVKYRQIHKWINPAIEKERKWKAMEKLITSAELKANNQATTIPPPEPLPQNDDGHVVMKPVFIKMERDWPIANIEDSVDVTLRERDVSLKTVGKATIEKTVGGYLARIKIMDEWVWFIKNGAILYPHLIGQISGGTFHFTSIHLGAVPLRKADERLELPE